MPEISGMEWYSDFSNFCDTHPNAEFLHDKMAASDNEEDKFRGFMALDLAVVGLANATTDTDIDIAIQ